MKSTAKLLLTAVVVAVIVVAPVLKWFWLVHRYHRSVRQVHAKVESLRDRQPRDVAEDQWRRAVDWTANLIYQDFSHPDSEELKSLQRLSQQLDEKASQDVNLGTLRWFWDECEKANGGPDSYAIRFRDVKLLTKGVINDSRLPRVWSLSRCTGLDLSGTEITDASLDYLKTLTQLEALDIRNTKVTRKGGDRLRAALPRCRVIHWPFDIPSLAVITLSRITDGSHSILYVVHDEDGDWQFLDGADVTEEDAAMASIKNVIDRDPTIRELADLPPGWAAERDAVGDAWRRFER